MKIALLPGHSSRDGGSEVCAGVLKGKGEYEVANYYIPSMAAELMRLGHEVVVTCREAAGGTSPSYSAAAANATGAELALELHFNAAGASASGCEVLYWGASERGRVFAQALGEHISNKLGVRHRGALAVPTPDNRGTEAFRRSKMPFFMVEPCFAGSNVAEAEAFGEHVARLGWGKWLASAVDAALHEMNK